VSDPRCALFSFAHGLDITNSTSQWNGQLPHKKVCKTIRALADAAGFPAYAIPKYLSELDPNARRRVEDAVSLAAVNSFNKNMMEDDRIRKVINDSTFPFDLHLVLFSDKFMLEYSPRYQRALD
jgi:hypothetical protein